MVETMEVSRLTISHETIKRINRDMKLSHKTKRRIRVEGIKKLVDSKAGGLITTKELYAAAGFPRDDQRSKWSAASFIKNIRKDGILNKVSGDWSRNSKYLVDMSKLNAKPRKKNVVNVSVEDLSKTKSVSKPQENYSFETHDGKVIETVDVPQDKEREFDFSLTISEKKSYGSKKLGTVEMTEATKGKMQDIVNELINRI